MSIPIKDVILPTIQSVLKDSKLPEKEEDVGKFIADGMKKCENVAKRKFSVSPNQLGRLNGDWFEYLFQAAICSFVKEENITVFPGRGHHINEINGFEKVTWIPLPDAIVRNVKDLRAVITLKWGMRHDRMYESAYEAYAIKDWIQKNKLPTVKVFLLTNDDTSGYASRLKIMSSVPALDGVYYVEYDKLSSDLQEKTKPIKSLIQEINSICKVKD